jgi:predicted HicB family RNase H-like nuclease
MMTYKGYHATVKYDYDDNIFVGEVFGVEDSLNFYGESVSELQEMFHQSVDNYLALCEETGKSPNKEFKGSFNVRIPVKLHYQAALAAKEQNISLNQFVIQAISQSLDKK